MREGRLSDFDEAYRMVLEAVSNDYEQFDEIVEQIESWTSTPRGQMDLAVIERSLKAGLESHCIQAYELSAKMPQHTQVVFPFETLQGHWFLITATGRAYLGKHART